MVLHLAVYIIVPCNHQLRMARNAPATSKQGSNPIRSPPRHNQTAAMCTTIVPSAFLLKHTYVMSKKARQLKIDSITLGDSSPLKHKYIICISVLTATTPINACQSTIKIQTVPSPQAISITFKICLKYAINLLLVKCCFLSYGYKYQCKF